MALDAIRDTLEGLDETVAGLYVEHGGKFRLDVAPAGGMALEDVAGLKSALEKERENGRKLKSYDGLDAGDIRTRLARLAELEESTTKPDPTKASSDLDVALAKIQAIEAKLQDERNQTKTFQSATEAAERSRQIASAVAKHSGIPDVLEPILESRVGVEWVDGRPVAKVRAEGGGYRMTQRAGDTSDMTVEEYVETLKAQDAFGGCFMAPAGGGSGARTSSGRGGAITANPFGKKTWNLTEQLRLEAEDPAKAERFRVDA